MNESRRDQSRASRQAATGRHQLARHFAECEASGRHSPAYYACLCRDLGPYLLAELRELESRAAMVLAGEPRRRVLSLLYDRQDHEPDRLVPYFIQNTDAICPWQLGFGHVGDGRMGITDAVRWQENLDEFRENTWITVVRESRKS